MRFFLTVILRKQSSFPFIDDEMISLEILVTESVWTGLYKAPVSPPRLLLE